MVRVVCCQGHLNSPCKLQTFADKLKPSVSLVNCLTLLFAKYLYIQIEIEDMADYAHILYPSQN